MTPRVVLAPLELALDLTDLAPAGRPKLLTLVRDGQGGPLLPGVDPGLDAGAEAFERGLDVLPVTLLFPAVPFSHRQFRWNSRESRQTLTVTESPSARLPEMSISERRPSTSRSTVRRGSRAPYSGLKLFSAR